MAEPRRGEVWITDLGFAAKVRPCLVVSIPALGEDRALATVVPLTTSAVALGLKSLSTSDFFERVCLTSRAS